MALAAVTLHESLRPWRAAGLHHILLDAPLGDDEPGAGSSPVSSSPVPGSGAGEGGARSVPSVPPALQRSVSPNAPLPSARDGGRLGAGTTAVPGERQAGAAPRPGSAHGGSRQAGPAQSDSGRSIRTGGTSSPVPLRAFSATDRAAVIAGWPEPWQAAFAKTRPSPVVWSYHELGLDLAGIGSPARGNFFRTLIGELRLPAGSSTFWPTAVPFPVADGEPELSADASVFHAGLACLGAKAVVLLGGQSLIDSEYGALPLYQQRVDAGRLIVHVPDLAKLMAGESHFRVAVTFLQSALGFLL